jgi:hypothetical protein
MGYCERVSTGISKKGEKKETLLVLYITENICVLEASQGLFRAYLRGYAPSNPTRTKTRGDSSLKRGK